MCKTWLLSSVWGGNILDKLSSWNVILGICLMVVGLLVMLIVPAVIRKKGGDEKCDAIFWTRIISLVVIVIGAITVCF